jgi:hypothetical protein
MFNRSIALAFVLLAVCFSTSSAFSEDLLSFTAKDCASVKISPVTDPKGPILHTNWCNTSGATQTVSQQISNGHLETCGKYRHNYGWGDLYQNMLFSLAVIHAKDSDFNIAIEEIAACECHNPPIEKLIRDNSREVVCWLRTK